MLTDVKIRQAKPREKAFKLSDAGGLYLVVTPNGARSWRYDYRLAGRRKTLAIGLYPAVPLGEARERHADARRLVARGICPAHDKQKARKVSVESAANTVQAIGEAWYAELAPHKSATWRENTRRWLDARVYPEIGSRPADAVDPADVLALIRGVAAEGHAKTAEYIRQTLTRIFQHGVRNLRCKSDPAHACRGAIVVPPPVHHRPLSAKELPDFLEAIDHYPGRRPTVIAGQLLLLTIVRKSELIGALWNELDLDGHQPLWRIPAERMKAGADHLVPLSRQAAELFRELKPISCGSEFMFPNLGRLDKPMSKSTLNAMFDRLKLDVTPHAVRATASTLLNESGLFRGDVVERALAHVERNRVRASYNAAEYLPERRAMLQWWADYIDGMRAGANVVPIRRTA